jgi:hypothetical protein
MGPETGAQISANQPLQFLTIGVLNSGSLRLDHSSCSPRAAHRAPIILAAARSNVPAVFWLSDFAREGGLLSYGVDEVDAWRRAGHLRRSPEHLFGVWRANTESVRSCRRCCRP